MGNIIQLIEQIFTSKVQYVFVVWFSNSRKFMMLKEPTYFVLHQLINNKTSETFSLKSFENYKNLIDKCQQFVSEVYHNEKTPYF